MGHSDTWKEKILPPDIFPSKDMKWMFRHQMPVTSGFSLLSLLFLWCVLVRCPRAKRGTSHPERQVIPSFTGGQRYYQTE